MKNSVFKRQLQNKRYFSEEFRIQKVKEIEQNQIGVSELCKLYSVSSTAVYNWMHKYSVHLKKGVTQVIEMESESRKTKLLQVRLAELERIVGQKQLQIDYLEKIIELGSEEVGIDIKKKFSTGQSNGSGKTKESIKWHMVEDSVDRGISDRARCTRRPASSAKLSARFLSSRPRANLFTAGTAGQNTEDIETPIILPSDWDF